MNEIKRIENLLKEFKRVMRLKEKGLTYLEIFNKLLPLIKEAKYLQKRLKHKYVRLELERSIE